MSKKQDQEKNQSHQQQEKQKQYQDYVTQVTPTHNLWIEMIKAFLVGGAICCFGQGIMNFAMTQNLDEKTASSWVSLTLIALSIVCTGFNIYPSITKYGGAGALVPITGFANSVAAPAIEYKKEGHVFGIGCMIFSIAGPVILYGIFTSAVLGFLYYFMKLLGII